MVDRRSQALQDQFKKSVRKGRQTTWVLERIGKKESHIDNQYDISDLDF